MCGIFGFITDTPSEENFWLFQDLCYLSEERGTDATGIAVVVDGEVLIDKKPIPSTEYIDTKLAEFKDKISRAHVAIGHTRRWTQGKPEDNHNNHPVYSNQWVMIHNGTCSSMKRIKDYPYKGEVDTEIFLSYIERDGIKEGLKKLSGSGAVALLNKEEQTNMYIWRHNENLYLGYDRDRNTIFFGSTERILENGLSNEMMFFTSFQIRKLPEDNLYRFSHSPLFVEDLGEIEPVKPEYNYPTHLGHWGTGYGYETGYNRIGYSATSSPSRTTYVWNKDLSCLVPQGTEKEKEIEEKPTGIIISNRYYFPKQSIDFANWEKVGKYYLSLDKVFIKMWDKDRKTHFIMERDDAIDEKLIIG